MPLIKVEETESWREFNRSFFRGDFAPYIPGICLLSGGRYLR